MLDRIASFSVERAGPVAAVSVLLAAGALALGLKLELDALPDITNNQVLVLTQAPGLTPEEVERAATRPVELAVSGAPGLVELRSQSRYGISAVTAVFDDDTSPWLARQLVSERLASVELSAGLPRPEIGPASGGLGEVFHVTLSSPQRTPSQLLELATLRVAPQLKSVPGVVELNSWGGGLRTLDVVGSAGQLAARGVTLGQLQAAVEAAVGSAPAGAFDAPTGQVLTRAVSRPRSADELGSALVPGASTRIDTVAQIVEGQRPRLGAATANGEGETVYLMAQMLRGANALEVVQRIHAVLPTVKRSLPDDVRLDVVYDRSELVLAALRTVAMNLLEGGVLVALVLLVFLGSWRAGLVVASVIPLSMAFATAAMRLMGVPGNLMSLGALDFGLLVDGAIVLVEGVFHVVAERRPASRAELVPVLHEVAGKSARPVFFAVTVILLVYVPVLTMTGVDGKLFRPMALTVVFALGAALVLSLTYVPALLALLLRPQDVPAHEPWPVRLLDWAYPPVLRALERHRLLVALGAAAVLALGVAVAAGRGVAFTPQLDEGDLVIQGNGPADASLDESIARALEVERVVRRFPEVRAVVSRIGSPAVATDVMGLEQSDVFVRLAPRAQWTTAATLDGLVAALEAALEAAQPETEFAFTQPIQMRFNELLGGAVTDVAVSVYGDDLPALRALAEEVAGVIAKVPGAADVRVLAPPSVPITTVRPKPLQASQQQLTARDVLDSVQAARVGLDVGLTWDGPVPIPVRVRLGPTPQASGLPGFGIPVARGAVVPLAQVAQVDADVAPGVVNRKDGERRLIVGFNVRGGDLGSVVLAAQGTVERAVGPRPGFRLVWGGQYENLVEATARLTLVVPLALVCILVVLLLTFRKLRPAFLILGIVPFASVGGVLALWARGLPVSLPAAIGFIALSGIAVMNGVVWVTRALELQDAGASRDEAAHGAALDRVRPVSMTALVAAFGFVPMMLATGVGAEVQRPLASVVVGGLVSSTTLTLLVLPVLYRWLGGGRRA